MGKKKNVGEVTPKKVVYNLPKGSLSKVNLGQSFAEYDSKLKNPYVFVETPAITSAMSEDISKCFYIGRRGTGKTATTFFLASKFQKTTISILPQLFSAIEVPFNSDELRDTRQRPFKSLVACFKRALLDEVLLQWTLNGIVKSEKLEGNLSREKNYFENFDFDLRLLTFSEEIFNAYNNPNQREWLRLINRPKEIAQEMNYWRENKSFDFYILIDRVDESWDGSDKSVILLMALMHACIELANPAPFVRPLLFLRENIFERVRQIDNEFARLETFVISVDWSRALLLEFIERRFNVHFNTKLPLRGETWDYFFENLGEESSRHMVFDYCQERPRDVLTYCSFALESAQSQKHEIVKIEDLQHAKRRFSDSRLKDLGDEYQENYPQIQLILARFYGLGTEYTLNGVTAMIKRLLIDEEVKQHCATWFYDYTPPDRFTQLLFNIGFWGIKQGDSIIYRSLGAQSPIPPPINNDTHFIIHPSYKDALNLREILIDNIENSLPLRMAGLLSDIPEAINLAEFQNQLNELIANIKTLPKGDNDAKNFEDIVGNVLKLCFFKSLTNVEPQVRDTNGRVIRDWIASNRAKDGFWAMIRQRYQSTQVIWECKNYDDLGSDVFHQSAYYMNREIGHFVVICFRGEIKKHYYEHIKRVSGEKDGGIILLLSDKDLLVFLRQALNGKTRDDHIQQLYDTTVRKIS
jgi:hypothetical protein